jgi:hypothetical protein
MARPQLLSACIHVMQAQETSRNGKWSTEIQPANSCELLWVIMNLKRRGAVWCCAGCQFIGVWRCVAVLDAMPLPWFCLCYSYPISCCSSTSHLEMLLVVLLVLLCLL